MATCSSADSVLEASSLIKANSEKLNKFVNGTDTQTVQLGSGSPTPSIRNVVRQVKADGEWIKQYIANAPEGDVSLNNATALGSVSSRTLTERFSDIVNVKDYGAVGDGVANDTGAFEAAAAAGDTLFVPEGTYYLPTEPAWPSGKSIVLFTVSTGASFTGTYGLMNIGTLGKGLTFRQINSDPQNGRHIINLYQKITDNGDASSGVFSSVYSTTIVSEGNKKKVWGITGAVRTNATNSAAEAVGGYFQGWRMQGGSSTPVWGGVCEARDQAVGGSPSGVVGIEVDCVSDGDASTRFWNRVGVDVVGGSTSGRSTFEDGNGDPQLNRLGHGVRVTGWIDAQTSGNPRQSIWHTGLYLSAAFDYGIKISNSSKFYNDIIDLHEASFDSSVTDKIALRMASTHKIAFSGTNAGPFLYHQDGYLLCYYDNKRIFAANTTSISGRGLTIQKYTTVDGVETYAGAVGINGTISVGSATATLNASNKPGSTNVTTPSAWLRVGADNSVFWVPLFKD